MSERERVIRYLGKRVTAAWSAHCDQEAASCERFLSVLEQMSDAEYDLIYSSPLEATT